MTVFWPLGSVRSPAVSVEQLRSTSVLFCVYWLVGSVLPLFIFFRGGGVVRSGLVLSFFACVLVVT